MKEIWKDIYFVENGVEYDYRGLYQVSNLGRIKGLERKTKHNHKWKEKILKTNKTINGYLQIDLHKNGKTNYFLLHRLVAHLFVEGYFYNAEVNHIDENKENNNVNNLEWVSHEYNMSHGTINKRMSDAKKNKSCTV